MAALGPSGRAGQGLENQAGMRAGRENGERTGGWDEGSRPGAQHIPGRQGGRRPASGPGRPAAALAFRKLPWKPLRKEGSGLGEALLTADAVEGRAGMGRLAAWGWYKPHGTGRGSGATVPSPPFLLEAAQGPWPPILRCLVPSQSTVSPRPASPELCRAERPHEA